MPNWKKIIVSGSDASLNILTVLNGITGSLFGTASYATQALSASFAPSTPAFPFTGSAIITGSLTVTGSLNNKGRINVGGVYAYSPTSSGITIVAPNESADYKGNLEIMSSTSGADNGGSIILGGMQFGPIMYPLAKIVSGYVGSSYGGYLSFWTELASSTITEKMRINKDGLVGIGTTTPTAVLHLKAGTATANTAPLKLTSGTNLTTPEAGAVEFDGNSLFFTTGSTRSTILTNTNPASISGNLILTGSLLVSGSVRLNGNAGVNITGNTVITGSLGVTGGITGSLQGTASYATQALSASYAPSAGGVAFPFTGSAIITGSLNVIGNTAITGSLVAGYNPTPLEGTIQDGVTSVLGNLNDWSSSFYQGTVLYSETAGGTITFGQLCYRTMFETWELADAADAAQPLAFNMLGICVKTAGSGSATSILINGFVETPYVTIGKSGEPLYMDTTAGSMNSIAPTTVGNAVRLIGHSFWVSNTNAKIIIHFNPDRSWIEL